MKTLYDAFKDKSVKFNEPLSSDEVEERIKELKHRPSEALIKVWKNVGSGQLANDWDLELAPVGVEWTFTTGDKFKSYSGVKKIRGLVGVQVGTLWPDTDSKAYVYEIETGENKGKVMAFAYGEFKIFMSDMTTEELIDVIKGMDVNTDWDEVSTQVFKKVFMKKDLSGSDEESD